MGDRSDREDKLRLKMKKGSGHEEGHRWGWVQQILVP